MQTERFLPVIGLLLAALVAAGAVLAPIACAAPDGAPRPNIVFILVDDLGWTDLGCFGSRYYETPNVDRLAAEGMRFTQAYAACAVCSPSRAAVLTGRYPARLGITDWIRARFQGGKIPADGKNPSGYVAARSGGLSCPRNALWLEHAEVTLAEALKAAGYRTGHIGKWHLGPDDWYPENQGFDVNRGGCDYGQPPSYFDPYANARLEGIPTLAPRREGEYLTDREADEACRFIRSNRERPFFLYLAHYAVHAPIQAKKELVEKYQTKPRTHHRNATYAAMIESVDRALGRILATLDELSLADRTILVFTSDNGGLLGPTDNRPLRAGKGFPYEGGIRVPLIIRWPGRTEPGAESTAPVTGIDYFPTLLEAAGVKLPADRPIDGISLVAHLTSAGKVPPAREAVYWHFPHYRGKAIPPYSIVRAGRFKLIRWWDGPRHELYDLEADAGETRDRSGDLPDRVEALSRLLDRHLEAVGAKLPRRAD